MSFAPRFTVTHPVTAALTRIERARGFLEAAKLSEDWIRRMGERALVLEAHHTTHIEGTRLTLEQSEDCSPARRCPRPIPTTPESCSTIGTRSSSSPRILATADRSRRG